MNKSLIVIVGVGPGVSAGIARKFGNHDFKVILISRTKQTLDLQLAALKQRSIEAYAIPADATNPDSLEDAFNRIKTEHGAPDVLVYNAGRMVINKPSVLTNRDLMNDFNVNVAGALTSSQQVIPDMIEQQEGTILFTGGELALNPRPLRVSGAVSKAGLRNLTFALAEEMAPYGIKVGTVTIGGVVEEGTFYDPDNIAEAYWELYTGRDDTEILFQSEET